MYNSTTFQFNTYSNSTGFWRTPKPAYDAFGQDSVNTIVLACDQESGNAGVLFNASEANLLYASAYNKSTDTWTFPTIIDTTGFQASIVRFVVDCHGTGIGTWQKFIDDTTTKTITGIFPFVRQASMSDPQLLDLFPLNTGVITLRASLQCCECDVRTAVAFSQFPTDDSITLQSKFFYYVLPPSKVRGKQILTCSCPKKRINVICWEAGCPPEVPIIKYRIYRDAALQHKIGSVKASECLKFKDKKIERGVTYTYYIVAVDENGNQSEPASVTIEPIGKSWWSR